MPSPLSRGVQVRVFFAHFRYAPILIFVYSCTEFKRSQNIEEFAKLEVELKLMSSCNCQFTAPLGQVQRWGGAGKKVSWERETRLI